MPSADVVPAEVASVDGALAHLARVWERVGAQGAPTAAMAQLGEITLLPHQVDAERRLRAALQRHGGALLADDVGLGKTYVALAVARGYARVDVIAPAVLVAMWRDAAARTGIAARVRSLHGFSSVTPVDGDSGEVHGRRLVVIDEAHHLRNPATRRYRRVAEWVVGAEVLLMSATPVHNVPGDLATLLALFSGARDDQLDPERLADLVVRREVSSLPGESAPAGRPPVVAHSRHQLPDGDSRVLERLLSLPPPLPVSGGAAATALVRLALVRAWCSSDAALVEAVRRRRARGAALGSALDAGRLPSGAELRSWAVGDAEVQLGFAELLAESGSGSASQALRAVLDAHVQALAELSLLASELRGDDVRESLVRGIVGTAGAPAVCFTQYTATARAYFRRLAGMGGVGLLTGSGARIASGPISRAEALARFAGTAGGTAVMAFDGRVSAHAQIRVLVATDLLAEGVNLQRAGSVVHLDLPWTDALLRQRVGRVARIGGMGVEVQAHTLEPPKAAAASIRVLELLSRKAADAARLVGGTRRCQPPLTRDPASLARGDASIDKHEGASAADQATRLRERLVAWARGVDPGMLPGSQSSHVARDAPMVAFARGQQHARVRPPSPVAALALVCTTDHARLVALRGGAAATRTSASVHRWRVTDELSAVLEVVDALSEACDADGPPPGWGSLVRSARVAIVDWYRLDSAQRSAGPDAAAWSPVQRRALREIAAAVSAGSALARGGIGWRAAAARRVVECACGVGAEPALAAWLDARPTRPSLGDWLDAWRCSPILRRAESGARARRGAGGVLDRTGIGAADNVAPRDTDTGLRVESLVLLCGDALGGQLVDA